LKPESSDKLKFRIADELRKVPMKTPAKAILWDLLMRANENGVIPARWTPSLTELSDSTCLGRSTVTTYLRALEATGWVVRERPSVADAINNGRRTQYRLAIGSFDLPPELKHEKHVRKPKKDAAEGGSGADIGQELNHEGSGVDLSKEAEVGRDGSGAELSGSVDGSGADTSMVQELNSDSSGAEHNIEPPTGVLSSTVQQGSTSAADAADEKTKPKKRAKKTEPQRDDVDALCTRLADWIVKNGSKPPTVGEAWKREARLLLDEDERDLDKALALIDWCQQDTFWRKNILGMPKFREQYDRLRLAALDDWEQTRRGRPTNDSRSVSSAEDLNDWLKKGPR
jgi:hypothetical protein